MKKIKILLLLVLCLLTMVGCKKEDKSKQEEEVKEAYVFKKKDDSKDLIYFEDYKTLTLSDGSDYKLQILILNMAGETSDNVNLEISSFVKKSYKEMVINDDLLEQGRIVSYDYYESKEFISIIQQNISYVNRELGNSQDNVYVISKIDGNAVSQEELLRMFGYDESSFYKELESRIDSEDVLYTLMIIKNNGYDLYVNDEDKLVVIYYEIAEEQSIRKELILG